MKKNKRKKNPRPTKNHASTDQRLEQALRIWEDRAFTRALLFRCVELHPEIADAFDVTDAHSERRRTVVAQRASVRQRLLHAVTGVSGKGLLQRDALTEDDILANDAFLWAVFGWCHASRRMYRIPGDLQLLLQATSVRNLWTDLKMPLEAFVLLLEELIPGDNGEMFDAILIHRYGEEVFPSYVISLLPTSYQHYTPIPEAVREQGTRAMTRGDVGAMARIGKKWEKRLPKKCPTVLYEPASLEEVPDGTPIVKAQTGTMVEAMERVMQAQAHDQPMNAAAITQALRLVFGFAHHVLTLPREEREGEKRPISPPGAPIAKHITQGGHVCLVQSRYTLTREERELFREYGKGNELVSAHFREGYHSRPPGLGSDPKAEKTVWHRPTIVRKDRLAEGELPYGREAVLPRARR